MAKKRKPKMNPFDWIAIILLVIGGVNWGLTGLFNINLVEILSFGIGIISKIIYALVGISGIYGFIFLIKQIIK